MLDAVLVHGLDAENDRNATDASREGGSEKLDNNWCVDLVKVSDGFKRRRYGQTVTSVQPKPGPQFGTKHYPPMWPHTFTH